MVAGDIRRPREGCGAKELDSAIGVHLSLADATGLRNAVKLLAVMVHQTGVARIDCTEASLAASGSEPRLPLGKGTL